MQILFPTLDRSREIVDDLACLAAYRSVAALCELAARSGIESALRAYDAGLTTPVLAEPGQ